MGKKVFIIQHSSEAVPGNITEGLKKLGVTFELHKIFENPLFSPPKKYDGVIILGGPMSVNDEDKRLWINAECEFIRHLVKKEIPLLGICLGGQLIAKSFGAQIKKSDVPELGWGTIYPTEYAYKDKLFAVNKSLNVFIIGIKYKLII